MKMHHPKTVSNLTAARRHHVLMDALEPRRLLANIFPTPTGLQAAIDSAQLGDTIILQAGTTYTGAFTLKNKTTGTGMITIQSSNLAQLPGAGVRVSPADA